jgi:hypothetical protein
VNRRNKADDAPQVGLPGFERLQRIDYNQCGSRAMRLDYLRSQQWSRSGRAHSPERDAFGDFRNWININSRAESALL